MIVYVHKYSDRHAKKRIKYNRLRKENKVTLVSTGGMYFVYDDRREGASNKT